MTGPRLTTLPAPSDQGYVTAVTAPHRRRTKRRRPAPRKRRPALGRRSTRRSGARSTPPRVAYVRISFQELLEKLRAQRVAVAEPHAPEARSRRSPASVVLRVAEARSRRSPAPDQAHEPDVPRPRAGCASRRRSAVLALDVSLLEADEDLVLDALADLLVALAAGRDLKEGHRHGV